MFLVCVVTGHEILFYNGSEIQFKQQNLYFYFLICCRTFLMWKIISRWDCAGAQCFQERKQQTMFVANVCAKQCLNAKNNSQTKEMPTKNDLNTRNTVLRSLLDRRIFWKYCYNLQR